MSFDASLCNGTRALNDLFSALMSNFFFKICSGEVGSEFKIDDGDSELLLLKI